MLLWQIFAKNRLTGSDPLMRFEQIFQDDQNIEPVRADMNTDADKPGARRPNWDKYWKFGKIMIV